jgi:hypothetical protein
MTTQSSITTAELARREDQVLSKLVEREVVCCMSQLIAHFAEHPDDIPDDYDDLMGVLTQDDWDTPLEWYILNEMQEDELAELCEERGVENSREALLEAIRENDDQEDFCMEMGIDCATTEALEHWAVTKFFGRKLKMMGEMVIDDFFGHTIWGRACSGQAISMDYVIRAIANEMEILPGQKNDWSV